MRTATILFLSAILGTFLGVSCATMLAPDVGLEPVEAIPIGLVAPEQPVVLVFSGSSAASTFPVGREGDLVIYLTSRHAIHDGEPTSVGTHFSRAPVTHIETHPYLDAALVWSSFPAREVLELSTEEPRFGQHVRSIGWIMANHLIVTGGYLGLDRMSAPIFYGMSGGPVLDDDDRVLGINKGTYIVRDDKGIVHPLPIANEFVAIADIADWLREMGVIH